MGKKTSKKRRQAISMRQISYECEKSRHTARSRHGIEEILSTNHIAREHFSSKQNTRTRYGHGHGTARPYRDFFTVIRNLLYVTTTTREWDETHENNGMLFHSYGMSHRVRAVSQYCKKFPTRTKSSLCVVDVTAPTRSKSTLFDICTFTWHINLDARLP
jgi:hypothetical protein